MASQYEHQAMYTSTEQTIRKGDIFGRGSPVLVVALCSSRYKCSDKNRMTWRRSSMALCLPFRPQPRTTAFCALPLKIKMVNSNIPHFTYLVSELHKKLPVQVQILSNGTVTSFVKGINGL